MSPAPTRLPDRNQARSSLDRLVRGQPEESLSEQPTAKSAKTKPEDAFERILFWVFLGALAWCPFWFGSNDLLAWGLNAILFPGIALTYEASLLIRGRRHAIGMKELMLPAALLAAVLIWVVIQMSRSMPPTLHHPIWQMTADALERPVEGSLSVNRDQTALALLRLITSASAFWFSAQLCRNSERALLLIRAVAIIGAAYSFYGLVAYAVTPGYVLWLRTSVGYLSSTFLNHNSFATFAGMSLVACCGLIFRLYRHEVGPGAGPTRFKLAMLIEVTGGRGGLLLGLGFTSLVALLLSGSRGGILATGVGLFAFAVLTIGRGKKEGSDGRETVVFVALLAAAALVAFGDVFIGRIAEQGLQDAGRIAAYTLILGSILDSPLTGFGYGTFADIFPMYRDRSIGVEGKWTMAHNTYLDVFQGLGVIFGALLIACIGVLVFRCLKGSATRQVSSTGPCVAIGVACLVGVHALVDFSLEIQAVTLTFMALLGAGVAQSQSSRLALND